MRNEKQIEIIPAILEREWEQIRNKILLVEGIFPWVQIDISDGRFSPSITWDEPQDLKEFKTLVQLEVHLMISKPWRFIEKWLESPVSRIIVHYESFLPHEATFRDVRAFIQKVRKSSKEIGLAFNIETSWRLAREFIPLLDSVLFLSVKPGFSGQKFHRPALEKISSLRAEFKDIKIEVDGGVNPTLARDLIKAGVSRFISGSYIFFHPDPAQALKEYQEEINKYQNERN